MDVLPLQINQLATVKYLGVQTRSELYTKCSKVSVRLVMTVLDLYQSFRESFPVVTKKADSEYVNTWGKFEGNISSAHV